MRKTLNTNLLTAVALAGSLAAFGCSTNRTAYGERDMSAATAGTMRPTSTPGSANTMGSMPGGIGPQGMLSSAPASGESASADALATIKADQAFRGKVLGPAAPGDNSVTPLSMQQTTGQFISPSLYANPQTTVNSSISSAPTPAIVSGAGGADTGGAIFVSGATLGATNAATLNGVQNVGVTGVSNTTATPITNGLAANTGIANAPAVASNVVATPILTSVGAIGQINAANVTATGGSVLGVTNVAPLAAAAAPTVTNTTATGTTNATVAMPATMASSSTVGATTAPTSIRARTIRASGATTTTTGNVRITTGANGAVLVTNQK